MVANQWNIYSKLPGGLCSAWCVSALLLSPTSRRVGFYLHIFVTSAMFSPLSHPYCTQNVLPMETWCLEELKSMSAGTAIACGSYCRWTCRQKWQTSMCKWRQGWAICIQAQVWILHLVLRAGLCGFIFAASFACVTSYWKKKKKSIQVFYHG